MILILPQKFIYFFKDYINIIIVDCLQEREKRFGKYQIVYSLKFII